MQSLKTAFVTKMKREIKKKTKITRAKRLLSNKKSFRRSSVNQSSNQPGVTAKEWKIHTLITKLRCLKFRKVTTAISRN